MAENVDRSQAALGRSFKKLGKILGLQEEQMKTAEAKSAEAGIKTGVKTAQTESGDVRAASNIQTQHDAGDYGTQTQAVAAQAQETREPGAPPVASMGGSQVQTAKQETDINYTLAVKKRQVQAITAVATANAEALHLMAKEAQGEPTGPGQRPAEGPELGGEPAPKEEAEEPAETPVAAPGKPSGGTDAIIQEEIRTRADQVKTEQEVLKALTDVAEKAEIPTIGAKQATVHGSYLMPDGLTAIVQGDGSVGYYDTKTMSRVGPSDDFGDPQSAIQALESQGGKRSGSGTRTMGRTNKTGADVGTPASNEPNPKVPHAAVDIPDMTRSPDPDQALAQEARTGSPSTPKARMPQEFGGASDTDYAQMKGAYRRAMIKQAKKLQISGMDQAHVRHQIEASVIHRRWKQVESTKVFVHKIMASALAEVKKRIASGLTFEKAVQEIGRKHARSIRVSNAQYRKAVREFQRYLRMAEDRKLDPGAASVPAGEHPEYTGPDAGTRTPDEISQGSDTSLTSPETQQVANSADAYLNAEHREDVAGTTAMTSAEKKGIVARLKILDGTHDQLRALASSWKKDAALKSTTKNLTSAISGLMVNTKTVGDQIESLMKIRPNKAGIKEHRAKIGQAVKLANRCLAEAIPVLKVASALSAEIEARNQRLARVGPALKVAILLLEKGQIDQMEIPEKVANYVKMTSGEFEHVAAMAKDIRPVPVQGLKKTAQHLPLVQGGDELTDSLESMWDD